MDNQLSYRLTLKDFFKKTMLSAANDTKKLDTAMGKLNDRISGVGRAFVGFFALSKLWEATKQIVLLTAATQSLNNAIIASSVSEGAGRANIQFLNREVDRLGLNLNAAQKGYKTFTGATIGSNIQGVKANKIFGQVSAAASVLGLSAEQTEGSFLALGQMLSKGTVQAEELRGQLAERIPGAFQIGARAMGMTTAELGDAMKKGLVDSEDFLVKFGNELEKTFGGKLEQALKSTQFKLNAMETAWQRLQVNIGNSTTGIINGTVSFIGSSLNALSKYFEDANIMSQNFFAASAKDFKWYQKLANETIGILTGYNLGLNTIVEQENFQRQAYKLSQPQTLQEAYKNKAELYKLSLQKDADLKNNVIDREAADRFQATFEGALKSVNDNIALLKGGKSKKEYESATGGGTGRSASIMPSTEVYGARPQNININVERLADIKMEVTNITEGMQEVRAIVNNELMEVLNDANQMAGGN